MRADTDTDAVFDIPLGDAPDAPRQRAFLADLLEPLAEQGFSVFAPDGFSLQGQARASAVLPLLTSAREVRFDYDPAWRRLDAADAAAIAALVSRS